MKQGIHGHKFSWYLIITAIIVISLCLQSRPVAAQSLEDYFQISYEPVIFSQNEIHGNELFTATIKGKATCTNDLPVSISEASIVWHVIAQNTTTGSTVELNSEYTESIKPFPSKSGEVTEINQVISLQFPDIPQSGKFDIIAELIEAKVKVLFAWFDVTQYLPRSQVMGSIEYSASIQTSSLPLSTLPPETTQMPTQIPENIPASRECGIAWWVWLIVVIAVSTTAVNIVFFLRYRVMKRTGKHQG